MKSGDSNIKLPLDSLLHRLEAAGFTFSTRDRMRILEVLNGPAKQYLNQPEKIKWLLGPVLARSPQEQETFYRVFDGYWKELQVSPEFKEKQSISSRFKTSRIWIITLIIISLSAAIVLLNKLLNPPEVEFLVSEFAHNETVIFGDTLKLLYPGETLNANSERVINWRLEDWGTKIPRDSFIGGNVWEIVIDTIIGSPNKLVVCSADDGTKGTIGVEIWCPNPPPLKNIVGPNSGRIGDTITFSIDSLSNGPFSITHITEPGMVSVGENRGSFSFVFNQAGVYNYEILIRDTTSIAYCQTKLNHSIQIENNLALLGTVPLVYVPYQIRLFFYTGAYLILALLIILGSWFFFRWWRTQPEYLEPALALMDKEKFAAPDKAPYSIPFRNLNQNIQTEKQQFQLADAMRLRQEGLRQEMDIPQTLNATVQKGGFPTVAFQKVSRPTEYLILVDEQSEHSHQSGLFHYVVSLLREQDVYVEELYYRKDFYAFWNEEYPDGVSLDFLNRQYPNYRLIIMGDGLDLVDPYGVGNVGLKASHVAALRQWKYRLLLSPRPPKSWTYQEALISKVLAIFPADLMGMAEAAQFIEGGLELEDLPESFKKWQEQLIKPRQEQDLNYRRWRKLQEVEDFLQQEPAVFRWFCALAVYAQPTWEMTIAIGEALGIRINLDRLLLLARLPWLQKGQLPPSLQDEMLKRLSWEDEIKARKAVVAELKAVEEVSKAGFANRALQVGLVFQDFLLNPEGNETVAAVYFLQNEKLLQKRQVLDLQSNLQRRLDEGKLSYKGSKKLSLSEYLNQQRTAQIETRWNYLHPLFLGALFCLLLVLAWLGLKAMEGSQTLTNMAMGEDINRIPDNDLSTNKKFFFFQEKPLVDSVIHYNNAGVAAWEKDQFSQALNNLQKAKALNHNAQFTIPEDNLGKCYYNEAVAVYNQVIQANNSSNFNFLTLYFREAAKNGSIHLAALHGLGLTHHYLGALDSAWVYKGILDSLTNEQYFDTLSLRPHLRDLLNRIPVSTPINEVEDTTTVKSEEDPIKNALPDIPEVNRIQGGTFNMGCQKDDPNCDDNEKRVHPVTLSSFNLGITEVTNKQYIAFLNAEGNQEEGGSLWLDTTYSDIKLLSLKKYTIQQELTNYPVKGVTWYGARAYCRWLSKITNSNWRLPSEAEWEYAARGGNQSQNYLYAGSDNLEEVGWFRDNSDSKTHPVGQKKANELGLYDMSGNVWEWVGDWYGPYPEEAQNNPTGPTEGTFRLLRGGSWLSFAGVCRSSNRNGYDPDNRGVSYGFRVAQDLPFSLEPAMEPVAGGRFQMGCQEGDEDCEDDEAPVHEVQVSNFKLSRYEITNQQFLAFLQAEGNQEEGGTKWVEVESRYSKIKEQEGSFIVEVGFENHPVVEVSWYGARAYCVWLSKKTGKSYRLPTEAEWEYAARGGNQSQNYLYAGSDNLEEVGWFYDNSDSKTHPVGQKKANELGLYDMSGNVCEWVGDWYGPYPEEAQNNPTGPTEGTDRVLRDGSWGILARSCRSTDRGWSYPSSRGLDDGFRVAQDLPFSLEPAMEAVAGGRFQMGCQEGDEDCEDDEAPVHEVQVSNFKLSRYEITNQQFLAFLQAEGNQEEGGSKWVDVESRYSKIKEQEGSFIVEVGFENHPVVEVSWYGARAYCVWLSKKTGKSYRLPTEAEWEYAARGGNQSQNYLYAGSDNLEEVGWFRDNSDDQTHPVGQKKANELGLYDMSGNVWEWVGDWYEPYPEEAQNNPTGPTEGTYRVLRGGSWYNNTRVCRSTNRFMNYPNYRNDVNGFRVAQD